MTKRQIIDEIMDINRSAEPEFLARFSDEELGEYLEHLQVLRNPRLSGDPHRYDAYFKSSGSARTCPAHGDRRQEQGSQDAVLSGVQRSRSEDQTKPFASKEEPESRLF